MEAIFGLIEDLMERIDGSDAGDAQDAKMSLKSNKDEFIKNLEELANNGNEKASSLLEKLKSIDLS